MLHKAEGLIADGDTVLSWDQIAAATKGNGRMRLVSSGTPDAAPALPATPPARYGEGRRFSTRALVITAAVHIAAVAGLLTVQHHAAKHQEDRLVAVTLSLAPPPPPSPQAKQPPQTQPVPTTQPLPQIVIPQAVATPAAIDPVPQPVIQPGPPTPPAPAAPPAPPAAPSTVQGGDLGTRMVSGAPPRYPVESRRHKEQGTVVLALILGLDGAVEQISVSGSSGFRRLDDAALSAVRKWRWEPTLRGGQAVKVRGLVEIPFVLQG
ncbi:energy transducer TonB [Novosphingobium sp. SCN 63-17]|uniref:energy transducer TonB n=1 Tax=Novosphingobium sp. SCN 63-17 TaxID=1660120 RepID=UPI000AB564F5|nr:energy transducer TonB [Novosphingobium sp. SCN 63-17]